MRQHETSWIFRLIVKLKVKREDDVGLKGVQGQMVTRGKHLLRLSKL
jgi:hypothetical protein